MSIEHTRPLKHSWAICCRLLAGVVGGALALASPALAQEAAPAEAPVEAPAGEPTYTYVDLGSLSTGPTAESVALGLNDQGQVVGWTTIDGCTAQGHPCRRAFLWDDGVMTNLGLLAGDEESVARAINNAGFVVGTSEDGIVFGSGTFHGFSWDGSMSPLPDLGSGTSFANDVNDSGLIVGYATDPTVVRDRAVTWSGGSITNVGKGEGHSYNRALGVNEAGILVGFAWNLFSPNDAILYSGIWNTIGGLDGPFQNAEAFDVNDSGVACGLQAFPQGSWHACLWTMSGAQDLGLVSGFGHDTSQLFSVNEAGLAVGRSFDSDPGGDSRAVFWDGGTLHDLNDLKPAGIPGVLFEAAEINENGDIAGTNLVDGRFRAFLMIREPWVDLGGASVGVAGTPHLVGAGDLSAGSNVTLSLTDAAPNALMAGWLSLSSVPVPVLGGTLHANPKILQILRFADAQGAYEQALVWPVGIAPGTDLWVQFLIQDGSVPAGITMSNGVMATTP